MANLFQIIGRLYDQHILDMAELHIQKFRGLNEFDSDKVPVGTKPCLIFSGPIFESDAEMKRVKSLMIDFFRGPVITHIRREGLEHVIQVSCAFKLSSYIYVSFTYIKCTKCSRNIFPLVHRLWKRGSKVCSPTKLPDYSPNIRKRSFPRSWSRRDGTTCWFSTPSSPPCLWWPLCWGLQAGKFWTIVILF